MGPLHHPTSYRDRRTARRPRVHRPRTRRCLLKGCEQRFRPEHARARYCGLQCRTEAQAWRQWKARRVYRATVKGRTKRNGQSRRYRERRETPLASAIGAVARPARVIPRTFFAASCDRPGCYECFVRRARSPLQRFCSRACRRALERVWQRERRWRGAGRQCRILSLGGGPTSAFSTGDEPDILRSSAAAAYLEPYAALGRRSRTESGMP
jgi:hypothetical protein